MPHQAAHTSEAIQQPAAKPCTHSMKIEAKRGDPKATSQINQ